MEKIVTALFKNNINNDKELEFYQRVGKPGISTSSAQQRLIINLYDKFWFFQNSQKNGYCILQLR